MKASIIIRAYNAEKTLARAIESALVQDFPIGQFEIMIVDDGSTDGTAKLLESYVSNPYVVLIEQENKGTSEAANSGLRATHGDYVILLDADDELLHGAVSALSVALDESSADYAYGEYFEEYGAQNLVQPRDPFKAPAGAFAWRREKLLSEGGFAGDTIFPEYAILLRTWNRWKGIHVAQPIFVYHRSSSSITGDADSVRNSIEILRVMYPERNKEIGLIRSYQL